MRLKGKSFLKNIILNKFNLPFLCFTIFSPIITAKKEKWKKLIVDEAEFEKGDFLAVRSADGSSTFVICKLEETVTRKSKTISITWLDRQANGSYAETVADNIDPATILCPIRLKVIFLKLQFLYF